MQELGLARAGGGGAGNDQLCHALGLPAGGDKGGAGGVVNGVQGRDAAVDDSIPIGRVRDVADDEVARFGLCGEAERDGGGGRELAAGQIDD